MWLLLLMLLQYANAQLSCKYLISYVKPSIAVITPFASVYILFYSPWLDRSTR